MSIRKGSTIVAGNIGQNVDSSLSPTSHNPLQNSVITENFQKTISQDNITNCVIKEPQNIKLNLYNGALSALEGTKIYVPNGFEQDGITRKFDEVILSSDLALSVGGSGWVNEPHIITISSDLSENYGYAFQDLYSGDNAPTTMSSQYGLWYDTANNIIRRTVNSGATWLTSNFSLPICIAINTNGLCVGVEQKFNSMGFIGNVFFALPGLIGLMPNGRNEDRTLRNTTVELTSVIIRQVGGNSGATDKNHATVTYSSNNPTFPGVLWDNDYTYKYVYDFENNQYYTTESPEYQRMKLARIVGNGTGIYKVIPNYAFRALDYNDREYITHQSSPSKYVLNLAVGAVGTQYNAPADGYFCTRATASGVGNYLELIVNSTIDSLVHSGVGDLDLAVWVPVSKGDIVTLYYSTNTPQFLKFIYANGAI